MDLASYEARTLIRALVGALAQLNNNCQFYVDVDVDLR